MLQEETSIVYNKFLLCILRSSPYKMDKLILCDMYFCILQHIPFSEQNYTTNALK